MDRSAENNDQDLVRVMMDDMVLEEDEMVFEDEIKNMRMKFVLDVAPVEIIDKEDDEDFIKSAVKNIYEIELVIHVIDHDTMYQYWSLKSDDDDSQLNSSSSSSSSSSCHHQHQHHLPDDDDDEEDMIMITCQPTYPPRVDKILVDHQGIFAAYCNDDYIRSLLHDVDVLYESEKLPTNEDLEEVKRCIMQRISEAKPAVLMAKPKTVRIRVHLSTIEKRYYANSAAATSAAAQDAIGLRKCSATCAIHFLPQPRPHSPPELYDDDDYENHEMKLALSSSNKEALDEMKPALRSSKEALETKICEKEDLISSSSSLSCPFCLIKFRAGVDKIMIMPCSHVFHWTCLMDWLNKRNTCPLCPYELPVWKPMPPMPKKPKFTTRWN